MLARVPHVRGTNAHLDPKELKRKEKRFFSTEVRRLQIRM